MSATLLFFAVLAGMVLLITILLTLCAIHIASDSEPTSQLANNNQTDFLSTQERRTLQRKDFPIACNDGSHAWFDRRAST